MASAAHNSRVQLEAQTGTWTKKRQRMQIHTSCYGVSGFHIAKIASLRVAFVAGDSCASAS